MSVQTADQVEFLTAAQVAQRLNVSLTHVHRVLRSGDLPCLRMSRKLVRVRSTDLDAYIERTIAQSQVQQ